MDFLDLPRNQGRLLRARPALELVLAADGFGEVGEHLGEDEANGEATSREGAAAAGLVARETGSEVGGRAHVMAAVGAFEDVGPGRHGWKIAAGGPGVAWSTE